MLSLSYQFWDDSPAPSAYPTSMKPTGENTTLTLPPALLAEIRAAADEERRAVADVLRDAMRDYAREARAKRDLREKIAAGVQSLRAGRVAEGDGFMKPLEGQAAPQRTPADSAARMLAHRPSRKLPEGETIRSMIEHGRA